MNPIPHKIYKFICCFYIGVSSVIGMAITLYCLLGLYSFLIPKHFPPLPLKNGFVLAEGPLFAKDGMVLYDQNNNLIIKGDIEDLSVTDDSVYGSRIAYERFSKERKFFLCAYGDDCSKTQDYTDYTDMIEDARARGFFEGYNGVHSVQSEATNMVQIYYEQKIK